MPLHPVLPLAASASLAVLLAACGAQSLDEDEYGGSLDGPTDHAGGQTGSASIGNPPECVCDAVAGAVVLRAVVDELTTTFKSHYSHEVSLPEALNLDTAQAYNAKRTGEKYLIKPHG